jgi:c-di-GMP-binding flagellar brake protein YcgR
MADLVTANPPQAANNVLYRSRIEIMRILQGLADEHTAVFAYIVDKEDEHLFISNIHSIHPDIDSFVLSYGPHKSINGALFRHSTLRFKANFRGGRVTFVAQRPLDATFGSQPVIKFLFPPVLLFHYREFTRISLPGEAALRCIVGESGEEQLDLKIIDISQDGMGCILHLGGNQLQKGMVLKNCRISLPNGKEVPADLMVRHSGSVTLKDGTIACRTGVRFVQTPAEIKPLIAQFIHILDDQ